MAGRTPEEYIEAYTARHRGTEAAIIWQAMERLLPGERDSSWLHDM